MIVEAKIPKHVSIGLTGVCLPSEAMMNRGLMVAKSVALVDIGHTMPVKVLNVSDKNVNIGRNNVIAHFEPLNDHVISNLSENDASNMCANVCVNNTGGESSESLEKFMTNFTVNAELHADEKITLQNTLWENKDCFVTAENPDYWCHEYCSTHNSSQTRRDL